MTPKPLTMNVLMFTHLIEELTVYLSNTLSADAIKLSEYDAKQLKADNIVPEAWVAVYAHTHPVTHAQIVATKAVSMDYSQHEGNCWSVSFLKKYYTLLLSRHFKLLGLPCCSNFV